MAQQRCDVFLLFDGDPLVTHLLPGRRLPLDADADADAGKRTAWGPPYFILAVSVVQVLVYACAGTAWPASWLAFDPHRLGHVWRFCSYMLVHRDAVHLALNAVIQCLLALPLEAEQGAGRTALVYLGGGVAGALATAAAQPHLRIVGASAGVYALLIAHLPNVLLLWESLRYCAPRVSATLLLCCADVAFSLRHAAQGNVAPRVGWTAHCAGALAGLLLGLAAFRRAHAHARTRRLARCLAFTLLALLVAAGIAAILVRPSHA